MGGDVEERGDFGTETEKPNAVTESLAGSVGVGVGGIPRGGGGAAAALRVVVVLILIILVLVILVVLGRSGVAERLGGGRLEARRRGTP